MPICDEHREEDAPCPQIALGHLFDHAFDGAVSVGAFALVFNPTEVPDEVLPGRELAEDILVLGEVLPSYGPGDLDPALVLLISQPLDKDLGELLYFVHQRPRWGLL